MSVREQVLRFLRMPVRFASEVQPAERDAWLAALNFAEASINASDGLPLRGAQQAAWRGLADARTGLVLGPPGTGKTHLLSWFAVANAAIAREAGRPYRVFITAFTRNAAGNLLTAIAEKTKQHLSPPIAAVYLGSAPPAGIDADVNHIEYLTGDGLDTARIALDAPHVFAASTVWSLAKLMHSATLTGGDGWTAPLFDLVCIDEASQMVLGHGLLGLAGLAPRGRVIVAGDDRQLPPIRSIQETVIDQREVGSSLYRFLSSVQVPEFVLNETFRLNAPLAEFPGAKFYDNQYVSAESVATRRLQLRPGWDEGLESWERTVLDPEFPIVILLHDGPLAATKNPFEVVLAQRLATRFRAAMEEPDEATFWQERLAIVSPHRAQNATIRQALNSTIAVVETVDRIQGKERDALILSYCVTDPEFALSEAEFIFSRERFNVAITRARSKLVVIISRRLLEVVPPEQEVLDCAELVREFVYDCADAGALELPDPQGVPVKVNIRLKGFNPDVVLPPIHPVMERGEEAPPEMTRELSDLLTAIRAEAMGSSYGTAASFNVANRLARRELDLNQLRDLLRLGHITLIPREGARGPFWSITPHDPPHRPLPTDEATVAKRIEEVVIGARRGRFAPFYNTVRDRFVWLDSSGNDVLRPQVERLARAGKVVLEETTKGTTIDLVREEPGELPTPVAPLETPLSDEDFVLLNQLEKLESRRINFGIVESWTSIGQLAETCGWSRSRVAEAIGRLEQHGHLMVGAEQRLRSRMAELAREVRYLKQRFTKGDAGRRPFLVRSLKVEIRGRRRPRYDQKLSEALAQLREDFVGQAAQLQAIDGIGALLATTWRKTDPGLARFQMRGLREIALGWHGRGMRSFVVSAETGSGKTEAACLPLIFGATADKLQGRSGTRAVLVYPRIRLAANQAQRFARYLATLSKIEGMPVVTLGLQTGQVPKDFRFLAGDQEELWPRLGEGRRFPFFACPECAKILTLIPGRGAAGIDRLICSSCSWRYDGWVGSKEGLQKTPPNFFLPTTESLHQWMHDPVYARIFGDLAPGTAPRAVLADEIHLYTHVHGAQVGFALRRLLARAENNEPEAGPLLAIGMSATLGRPIKAWEQLCGRTEVMELRPEQSDTDENPRGREYFYFVQPEVESRGRDVAGASTTIQSLMCLAHGMRRRTATEGGYRSLVFLDSIDKLRRVHGAYCDAEEQKCLAAYRTRLYDDHPNGEPREECCGDPVGCDAFRDGECWYFAATDSRQWGAGGRFAPGRPLKVAERPVFSETSGNVEEIIKGSDIVFATSSLEVGYDDPDITLVYQHYAPRNLASFIQRKGRGGRGTDDRSLTGVTLSPYSPRDSWFFRRPEFMLEPAGFEVPLNPNNLFVQRGQLLAALLDGFAQFEARTGRRSLDRQLRPIPEAITEAMRLVDRMFGSNPWALFAVSSAEEFWAQALLACRTNEAQSGQLPALRRAFSWVPNALFESVNLPATEVKIPENDFLRREEVTLALTSAAPGNMTRRFDQRNVHWIVPVDGFAPWLQAANYVEEGFEQPDANLAMSLPAEIRASLGPIHPRLFRPVLVHVTTAGRVWGTDWEGNFSCETTGPSPVVRPSVAGDGHDIRIHHESRSTLSGCLIVDAVPGGGSELSRTGIERLVTRLEAFRGDVLGRSGPGLYVTQVFWGAEAELRFMDPKVDAIPISQRFKHPQRNEALLHGYRLETEGVRIHLDSAALNGFITGEIARLAGTQEERWFTAQMLRYLLESRSLAAGINGYDARRGAELFVSAMSEPTLKSRVDHLLRFWDVDGLATLLADTRQSMLAQHPLLTGRRVERTARALGAPAFRDQLRLAIADLKNPAAFAQYLRSVVLHSLAIRLKQSFVMLGRSDDSRVFVHARFPIQFGEGDDIITVAEVGEYGDGTTRTFIEHLEEARQHWHDGFMADCPSAREDAVVEQVFARSEHHERWRNLDPRSERNMRSLAEELGGEYLPLATAVRVLFGSEVVGSERFDFYDLTREIREVASTLRQKLQREPSLWELVSAAVVEAQRDEQTRLSALLQAYTSIEDASMEESLGPRARLADQVHRLSTRLCLDGCPACLHIGSDMMSTSLLEVSTSRTLLERFLTN